VSELKLPLITGEEVESIKLPVSKVEAIVVIKVGGVVVVEAMVITPQRNR